MLKPYFCMMLFSRYISLFALLLSFSICSGQVEDTVSSSQNDTLKKEGYLVIVKDSKIDDIIEQYIRNNSSSSGIEGYRVQIYNDSGNNARSRSLEIKESFENAFPDIPAHLQYQQPNFKVRVCDCRTKLEAQRVVKEISSKFPDAFVVKDFIKKN